MKIGYNKDINKDCTKWSANAPEPGRAEGTTLKMDKP